MLDSLGIMVSPERFWHFPGTRKHGTPWKTLCYQYGKLTVLTRNLTVTFYCEHCTLSLEIAVQIFLYINQNNIKLFAYNKLNSDSENGSIVHVLGKVAPTTDVNPLTPHQRHRHDTMHSYVCTRYQSFPGIVQTQISSCSYSAD